MSKFALRIVVCFLAAIALLQALNAAPAPIYKCTSAAGAITFSPKPCNGATQTKKIVPTEHVVESAPVLPGNIPGRKGAISPIPSVDTRVKRTPMPELNDSCRSESFNLKRELDNRFSALESAVSTEDAALAKNTQEIREAQTSKVGAVWSISLEAQRRGITARLNDARAAKVQFYPDEKRRYEEIASRCKK